MEFSVGDNFTYSAEVTLPIVYKSKESALHDFELLLIEKIELQNLYQEELLINNRKLNKIYNNIRHILDSKKLDLKQKETKKILLTKELQEFNQQNTYPLNEKIQENQKIFFGGQTTELSIFTSQKEGSNRMQYFIPSIFTLDEFFKNVEPQLNITQSVKPKV